MGTKVKGVLKGLRFISHIFEDEKKKDNIQIGFPTDVKHVAHIGWDGPSASIDNAPSWMKDFKEADGHHTNNEESKENRRLRCGSQRVSQDSLSLQSSGSETNLTRDLPDLPKPSRRHSSENSSPKSFPEGRKPRQSRKHSSKSHRKQKDPSTGSESPSREVTSLPKKSSRKKTRDSSIEGSSRSKTEDTSSVDSCSSSFSELELGADKDRRNILHSTSLKPNGRTEDKKQTQLKGVGEFC